MGTPKLLLLRAIIDENDMKMSRKDLLQLKT